MSAPTYDSAERTQRLSSVARSWPKLGVLAGVAFVGSAAVVGGVTALTASDSVAPPAPLLAVPAVGNPIVPVPAATPAPPPPALSQAASTSPDTSQDSSSEGSSSDDAPAPASSDDGEDDSIAERVKAAQERAEQRPSKAREMLDEMRERMGHHGGGGRHRG